MVVQSRKFIVYVLELDQSIKQKGRFVDRNPKGWMACLYVGSTGKTAEERFVDHAEGRDSGSAFIVGHVLKLREDLAPPDRFDNRHQAERFERRTANRLRHLGYFVWQN